ncbi:hypothetical protein ES706_01822 [subsurface metagenome]
MSGLFFNFLGVKENNKKTKKEVMLETIEQNVINVIKDDHELFKLFF